MSENAVEDRSARKVREGLAKATRAKTTVIIAHVTGSDVGIEAAQ